MKRWLLGMAALDLGLLISCIAVLLSRVDFSRPVSSGSTEAAWQQENQKKIAITFDDGPHPTYTEDLLDGLKERGVHATFFVTGEHAELHPDIIQRMQEDA